ncbi:MAG: GxxExxY protein [Pirellulaceae bacterium]
MQLQHEAVTQAIIGCAFRVHKTMGFGFLESVYEACLLIELRKHGIRAEPQQEVTVYYDGHPVGVFRADMLVEGHLILEIKSIQQLAKAHELQLVNYLVATRRDLGLLINFGPAKVEVKRKYRTLDQLKNDLPHPPSPGETG